jgi:hypothetical protein
MKEIVNMKNSFALLLGLLLSASGVGRFFASTFSK